MLAKGGPCDVIYDALEDIPDPLQLKKAVLTFANHGTDVVCVQARLVLTTLNLLTRWFTAEYSAWFDLICQGCSSQSSHSPWEGRQITFVRQP